MGEKSNICNAEVLEALYVATIVLLLDVKTICPPEILTTLCTACNIMARYVLFINCVLKLSKADSLRRNEYQILNDLGPFLISRYVTSFTFLYTYLHCFNCNENFT